MRDFHHTPPAALNPKYLIIVLLLFSATKKIVSNARQIVDVRKDDGFSALHLSALNGHRDVASILIKEGNADLEIKNNRKQTPLSLGVSQGHADIIELLVSSGETRPS